MKRFKQVKKWVYSQLKKVTPGNTAIQGASVALLIIASIFFILTAIYATLQAKDPWFILLFLLVVIVTVITAYLILWVLKKFHRIPRILKLSLLIAIALFSLSLAFEPIYIAVAVVIAFLLGAAIAIFRKGGFRHLTTLKKTITISGLLIAMTLIVLSVMGYVPNGFEMTPVINAAALNKESIEPIKSPSPAQKGTFTVQKLTYGSGKDKHREAFGKDVSIKTDSINGTPFLDNWEGLSGWYREQFWGFDAKALPVNGYVWYPEGEGPFPLVLIVHGNHLMTDFSDSGYEYLGELLASRGMIVASVDQNFLNGSWSDIAGGLEEENDARGWVLLEHLRTWHQWNGDASTPFFNKVDTSKIALIGHSRGGEAVGHAAFLNKLPFYSDDASIPLGYNYNIQSIIAIAPVDKQYEPGNSPNQLKDLNYFTLHGSQDGDVTSFAGSKQYERITFSDSTAFFKAGLYVQGANHGQFNTSWGDNDTSDASTHFLNNKQLLDGDAQRAIAKVYISAFLETTLKKNKEYLPLFTDARKGRDWLRETIYLNQYEDSSFQALATYDEDFNVLTAVDTTLKLSSKHLTVWKEQEIDLKWGEKGSRAAYIGWHYEDVEKGAMLPDSLVARYIFDFKNAFAKADSTSTFTFSLAESTESSTPKTTGKWINADEDEDETQNENEITNYTKSEGDDKEITVEKDTVGEDPIDFTIRMEDASGNELVFCLSDFSALQREIGVRIWKAQFITGDTQSEKVFQTFMFPLEEIAARNSIFETREITQIQFLFDKTTSGVVVLDNVGFMKSF